MICRWRHLPLDVVFDLMPVDEQVLGFTNRWYAEASSTAKLMRLADDVEIRVVNASTFVATKLEVFIRRDGGDFLSSHDLEDVLTVVDGQCRTGCRIAGRVQ